MSVTDAVMVVNDRRTMPLIEWAESSREEIRQRLALHGLCHIRGFDARESDVAQRLMLLVCGTLMEDVFWSTPRARVSDKTFTATEYPAREEIPMHSEMAYHHRYPRLLCFHALTCADHGGQTTVADLDAVSHDLDETIAQFLSRGVQYVRVFREGLDIPIEKAFGTGDRHEIARMAEAQGMRIEPAADGATRLVHRGRGAVEDAITGRPIWFNQMHLFHAARLSQSARESLVELLGEEGLPRQAFYGDGGAIDPATVRAVSEAFARHTQEIDWQPSDVVLVDNLRYAHGRRPFVGTRKVHVSMGMPQTADRREPLTL